MQRDTAETIGIRALAWLASNDDLLPNFLGATGADIDDLKTRAADPEFLGAVLDFLMMDDAWVMGFCADLGYEFDAPMSARMALPGGAQVNWT